MAIKITIKTTEEDLRKRFAGDPDVYVKKMYGNLYLCSKHPRVSAKHTVPNAEDMVPVPGIPFILMHPKDIATYLNH